MRCSALMWCAAALATAMVSLDGCGEAGTPSPEVVCESFCANEAECLPPDYQSLSCEADCLCLLNTSLGEAACAEAGPASLEVYSCGAALSCGDFFAYVVQVPPDDYPCKAAFDRLSESMDASCAQALMPCWSFPPS